MKTTSTKKVMLLMLVVLNAALLLTACGGTKAPDLSTIAGEYLSAEQYDITIPNYGTLKSDITVTLKADGNADILVHIYDPLQFKFSSTYTYDGKNVKLSIPDTVQVINRETMEFEDNDAGQPVLVDSLGKDLTIQLDSSNKEFSFVK